MRIRRWWAAAGLVVVAAAAALVIRDGEDGDRPLPIGPPTTRPNLSGVDLGSVEGTTTTSWPSEGEAVVEGRVLDVSGDPVPGAIVRAEWYVVDPPLAVQAATAGDGSYRLDRLPGGRWRVRAFLPPEYATVQPSEFFLAADEARTVDLRVARVDAYNVTWDVEPDPPIVDLEAELVVQFTERSVDEEGRVETTPLAGMGVTLFLEEDWDTDDPAVKVTDGSGVVRWRLACRRAGRQRVEVSTSLAVDVLDVAACIPISATSTTTSPPAEGGDGAGEQGADARRSRSL